MLLVARQIFPLYSSVVASLQIHSNTQYGESAVLALTTDCTSPIRVVTTIACRKYESKYRK